jgi:hypothetical protein
MHFIESMRIRYTNPEFNQLTSETTEMVGQFEATTNALLSTTGQEFDPQVWIGSTSKLPPQAVKQELLSIDHYIKKIKWGLTRRMDVLTGTMVDVFKALYKEEFIKDNPVIEPRVKLMIEQMSTEDSRVQSDAKTVQVASMSMEQYITTMLYFFNCVFAVGPRQIVFEKTIYDDLSIALNAMELWALLHLAVPRFDQCFRMAFSSLVVSPPAMPPHAFQYEYAEQLGAVVWNGTGAYCTNVLLAASELKGGKQAGSKFLITEIPSVLKGAKIADMQSAAQEIKMSPLALYIAKSVVESEAVMQQIKKT